MRRLHFCCANPQTSENASIKACFRTIPDMDESHVIEAGQTFTFTDGNIISFTAAPDVVYAYKFKNKREAANFRTSLEFVRRFIAINIEEGALTDLCHDAVESLPPGRREWPCLEFVRGEFFKAPRCRTGSAYLKELMSAISDWDIEVAHTSIQLEQTVEELDKWHNQVSQLRIEDGLLEIISQTGLTVGNFLKEHGI